MVSAAERLASNFDLSIIGKATELKQRLWFVFCALIVARIGAYIPLPGINLQIIADNFKAHTGGVFGVFNMFSGGSLFRMSIFALAIMPYISASIIIQLMTIASPHLAALKKEGEAGRRKINRYTRYGTVLLAFIQGYGISNWLESMHASNGISAAMDPGLFFRLTTALTLVGGTMLLMWIGDQITARGIGNGISLIIFAGIVAGFPGAIAKTLEQGRTGALPTTVIVGILVGALALVAFIVFMERAQRRIIVQYPKRQVGLKVTSGESSHLPLKLNMSGVIPPIFASSILLFPLTLAGFSQGKGPSWITTVTAYLGHGQPLYIVLYMAIIIFFSFFYTSVVFNTTDTADNLKKYGGFIAGIRPGKNTADYLDYVITRLTTVGALYLAFVCALPEVLIANYNIPFYLGGTSILISINVLLDFIQQVHSHLIAHQYEGLIKKIKTEGETVNLILLGPPGAGKGTQAETLQKKLGLAKLSTGDMLRDSVRRGTALGAKADAVMKAGKLVSDDIMIALIRERITHTDCEKGFILDGFPRTTVQAEALDVMLAETQKPLTVVIELTVNDPVLIERIAGRFSCLVCGTGYHDVFKKPKVAGVCDSCGSEQFNRRKDDTRETVTSRLEAYHAQTAPLLPYYKAKGILRSVDGMAGIATVAEAINKVLDSVAK